MANLVRTAKGRLIDLNQLAKDNQKAVALGNGHMNARGDIIKHGKVVKTVEEQRKEYEEVEAKITVSKNISVSSNSDKLEEVFKQEVEELKPKHLKKAPKPAPLEEPAKPVVNEAEIVPVEEPKPADEGFTINDIFQQQ